MPACLRQSQQRHGSPISPLCLGRSSVFGEKVETVMMQKLNDKGQSLAAPPREVSRSAKSTWTGTRAVPASGQGGWGRAGRRAIAHSSTWGDTVNRKGALRKAAPLLGIYLLFLASFPWSWNLSKPWATTCAVTVPAVLSREALLTASPVTLLSAPLCSRQSLHPPGMRE